MSNNTILIEHPITNLSELKQLREQGVFNRPYLGLIALDGGLEDHPQKSHWQNELNTHYYACGCDESAAGFFIGVILGSLWVASSWFQGVIPDLKTIIIGVLFAAAGGLIGKAIGKLIAHNKLKQTIHSIQSEWSDKS